MLGALGIATVLTLGIAACDVDEPEIEPPPAAITLDLEPVEEVPQSEPAPEPEPVVEAASEVTFVAVIDGDTVETSAGKIRIIGIDSPERGQCGYDEASMAIGQLLAPGDPVELVKPEGQNDQDRYGRLIRYVITADGVDIGLMQLQAGNAVARYDSTDGYPKHPREADYHAAQIATKDPQGPVVTTVCAGMDATAPDQELVAAPVPAPDPGQTDSWWTQYSSCTKLKKNTVGHPKGPFNVNDPAQAPMYEWFAHGTGNRGDRDGDGLACE